MSEHVAPNRDGETDVRAWRPEDGDKRCQRCGEPNFVWFTDADTWNSLHGDESGILCIRCFIGEYETRSGPVIWSVFRERPGPTSELSRGFDAGRASIGAALAAARAEVARDMRTKIETLADEWQHQTCEGYYNPDACETCRCIRDLRALLADGGEPNG